MQLPQIVVVGDLRHADFAAASAWLQPYAPQCFAKASEAASFLDTHPSPHWLMLFSAERGAITQKWVERLHRRAPLARLVHICGSWCEGESRTGKALGGVARVYWHQFVPRAEAAIPRRTDYAGWSLPRTATPLDLLPQRRAAAKKVAQTVAIVADQRDDYLALVDALTACGFEATRFDVGALAADVVLYQGRSLDNAGQQRLAEVSAGCGGRPLILLLDFPRRQECAQAAGQGIAAVLSKPLLLGDLRGALARCGSLSAAAARRQAG